MAVARFTLVRICDSSWSANSSFHCRDQVFDARSRNAAVVAEVDDLDAKSIGDYVLRRVVGEARVFVLLRTFLEGDGHPLACELTPAQLANPGDYFLNGVVGVRGDERGAIVVATSRRPGVDHLLDMCVTRRSDATAR